MDGRCITPNALAALVTLATITAACTGNPTAPEQPDQLQVDALPRGFTSDLPGQCRGPDPHGSPYAASDVEDLAQYEDSSFQENTSPQQKADLFEALASSIRSYKGQAYEEINVNFSDHFQDASGGHSWSIQFRGILPTANNTDESRFHFQTQDPYRLYVAQGNTWSVPRSDGDAAIAEVQTWNETHEFIPPNYTLFYFAWGWNLKSCMVGEFAKVRDGVVRTDDPRYWAFIDIASLGLVEVREAPPIV